MKQMYFHANIIMLTTNIKLCFIRYNHQKRYQMINTINKQIQFFIDSNNNNQLVDTCLQIFIQLIFKKYVLNNISSNFNIHFYLRPHYVTFQWRKKGQTQLPIAHDPIQVKFCKG